MRKTCMMIGIVICLLTAALAGCSTAKNNAAAPTPAAQTQEAKITKEEFDKAALNMSYDEVAKVVGGPGKVLQETGSKDQPGYTLVVEYKGENGDGSARFTFINGKLSNKSSSSL
ncbi:DUF3862 domain-containing protein [Paenibacillus sp. P25]|nr:DUF3862 domain-containing protein [Paenibacillus sp. P25]